MKKVITICILACLASCTQKTSLEQPTPRKFYRIIVMDTDSVNVASQKFNL